MGSGAHTAQGHLSRPRPPVWSLGKQKCLGEAGPQPALQASEEPVPRTRGHATSV